ncbi:hypothetical protein ACN9ML_29335 [Dyadobacter endophyticus]|uniref:hypothetical protein n=1 Tax=Dyadobacter endophyticus TaxID=1749036 RepID=UPI003CFB232C
MQKLILTIGLWVLFSNQMCHGQKYLHEFLVGYGPFARQQVLDDLVTNYFKSIFNRPLPRPVLSNSYAITYRYQPRRRIAIGATFNIATGGDYKSTRIETTGDYKYTSVVIAFETKFIYKQRSHLTLYGVTGLGGLLVREKDRRIPQGDLKTYGWPTCQVTPFGIRLGKQFAAFAEVGYGYKGILNAGLSTSF